MARSTREDTEMDRTPRTEETRDVKQRRKAWVNPNQLLDPEPREGIVHRWVRKSVLGQEDSKNVSSKFREGWEVCPPNEYPEFAEFRNEGSNQIEYGGLILCRTDQEVVDQRTAYYQNLNEQQITGVDRNYLRESDRRMPLSQPERRTRTVFGNRQG